MSLVPYNPPNHHHQKISLADLFQDRLPSLGIRQIPFVRGGEKILTGPYVKTCRYITMVHPREDTIMILSPRALSKLKTIDGPRYRDYFDHLISGKTALVICAQQGTRPDALKKELKHRRLPIAFSTLHENVLESRLKAIIQEKIKRYVTLHGVALEHQGAGILITGPSGIGKTTTALQMVPEGYRWIADDRVLIKKNRGAKLFICGHPHIKEYLHTDKTGIVAVARILNQAQVKKKAVLTAIIHVIRTNAQKPSFRLIKKNILGEEVSCMLIGIPRTGYLEKNMLTRAIQRIKKVG